MQEGVCLSFDEKSVCFDTPQRKIAKMPRPVINILQRKSVLTFLRDSSVRPLFYHKTCPEWRKRFSFAYFDQKLSKIGQCSGGQTP